MSIFPLLASAALLVAAAVALLPRVETRHTPGFAAVWPGAVAAVLSLLGLVNAVITGVDLAGAAVSALVVTLTVVVQVFADRHLRGDPRSRAFFALSALVAVGSTAAVSADSVVLLAVGWTLATLAMVGLIGTGGRGPQTRAAVRRAGLSLAIGDAALWAAVVVVISAMGSAAVPDLATLRDAPALAAGVLVAIAAIARAGSFPLHTWLSATAATTTPASALLHAGFVTAGARLLLRFAEVPSILGPWLVGIAGAATMLLAAVAMLTRPDVKGRLVQSTAAQMGFMLMACGLGAYGVALVHVLGHALFKASLFLGAGSAVERAMAARSHSPRPASRPGRLVGAGVVVLAGTGAILASGALAHTSAVLLLFVVATAAVAGARIGAGRRSAGIRAGLIALVSGAVVGYVLLVARAAEALTHVVPASVVPPLFAVAVFLAAGALALIARTSGPAADRLFAWGFAWGRAALPISRRHLDLQPPTTTATRGPLEYGRFS